MSARIVVGLDGGGTGTRAVVMAGDEILGEGDGPPGLVDPRHPETVLPAVVETTKAALKDADVDAPPSVLWAALAGVGRAETRERVQAEVEELGLAEHTQVGTDVEAAFHDAFRDGPGVLLLSGTGSVAWGRGEDGEVARVGGWGALLGDEGSGYALGLEALRAVARSVDERAAGTRLAPRLLTRIGLADMEDLIPWVALATKGEVAALAPVVLQAAEEGDPTAEEILDHATRQLHGHVETLLERLGPWERAPGVALAGGILGEGGLLEARTRESLADLPVLILDAEVDGARGAARLARKSLEQAAEAS